MIQSFSELPLRAELQQALTEAGYVTPTPIQAQAMPPALAGRDVVGVAQTGTGKTAAFTLPILERLSAEPVRLRPFCMRALILTPTRELALQIDDNLSTYGAHLPVRHTVIFGGVGQGRQVDAMRRGIDILVATPGRLLDLMNQGYIHFDQVAVFVLDEADRMLDMGFIHDVKRVIAKLPADRQTMFFSATMPTEVQQLASNLLTTPVQVAVAPQATTADRITQSVVFVSAGDKRQVLVDLLADPEMERVIVFMRTKHGANKVEEHLAKAGIRTAAIHGNKSQSARQYALEGFRKGHVRVLVATDIAARGIDVEAISHVVNFELPNMPESYIHRIGRTARAGHEGAAISLCAPDERSYLRQIERLVRIQIPVVARPPASHLSAPPVAAYEPVGESEHANSSPRGNHSRPQGGERERTYGPRPAQHSRFAAGGRNAAPARGPAPVRTNAAPASARPATPVARPAAPAQAPAGRVPAGRQGPSTVRQAAANQHEPSTAQRYAPKPGNRHAPSAAKPPQRRHADRSRSNGSDGQ